MSHFIGKGERSALKIAKELIGEEAEYKTQYPFKNLMKGDYADTLSERQLKETLDIVIFQDLKEIIVVRVQGGAHTGILKSSRDTVQKKMLEWNGCKVIDLWYYECPILWKEIINDASRFEVKSAFIDAGFNF